MGYAGIDLGGSKAALCCVDDAGTRHEQVIAVTADRTADAVIDDLVQTLLRFIRVHGPLNRIAIASAPEMDAAGIVTRWPNRPQWTGTPVATRLSMLLACEVIWCDDGTAAASADAAALAVGNLVHFSLGTGVGGGIVMDGMVLPDRELGHLIVFAVAGGKDTCKPMLPPPLWRAMRRKLQFRNLNGHDALRKLSLCAAPIWSNSSVLPRSR